MCVYAHHKIAVNKQRLPKKQDQIKRNVTYVNTKKMMSTTVKCDRVPFKL